MFSRVPWKRKAAQGIVDLGIVLVGIVLLITAIISLLAGLGASLNIAFYYLTDGFLLGHLWFAGLYSSVSIYFFYSTLVFANLKAYEYRPSAVILSVIFTAFIYVSIMGSIELLYMYLNPETSAGLFTLEYLTGVLYSAVGASAAKEVIEDNSEEDKEEGEDE